MKPSTLPVACSIAMTAALSAGLGHWWSVRQFVGLLDKAIAHPPAQQIQPLYPSSPVQQPVLASTEPRTPATAATMAASPSAASRPGQETILPQQAAFYQALMEKLARVEGQNRDLLDQLAETNRDLMKLEFRVDTHSESFRPLPVVEDKPFSSVETDPGVLPPRAEPIQLPSHE